MRLAAGQRELSPYGVGVAGEGLGVQLCDLLVQCLLEVFLGAGVYRGAVPRIEMKIVDGHCRIPQFGS